MNLQALHPKISAADIPLEKLAGNPNISDREKVSEVSRQFEAVLLRQILHEARKSSVAGATGADSVSSGIYDDMINDQLADSISRSGTFGLARSLQGQLADQVLPESDAGAALPAATARAALAAPKPNRK